MCRTPFSRSRKTSAERRTLARWLGPLGFLFAILLVLLGPADLLVPARDGILGYSRVFAPYLALLFVPLDLVTLWLRGRPRWLLGVIVIVGLAMATVRFLPVLPSVVADTDPSLPQVRLATWNLELDASDAAPITVAILERAPGLIGLQELTPDVADAIAADPELRAAFAHQILQPASDWTGMGLLSSWPLESPAETSGRPPLIEATVLLPDGSPLDVLVAHAPPPTMGILRTGPRYDPTNRDISIGWLRERVRSSLDTGRPMALLGDFNATDREIAYEELSDGPTDSYRAAGSGWGHTWRPPIVAGLPFGLLRLDLVLTGPGVIPITSEPDCAPRGSDHCILDVVAVVEGVGEPPVEAADPGRSRNIVRSWLVGQ